MTSLEEMKIYQNYVDLFYYTYKITEKYPKYKKEGLVVDIKEVTKNESNISECLDLLSSDKYRA